MGEPTQKSTTAWTWTQQGGDYMLTTTLSLDAEGKALHLDESGVSRDSDLPIAGTLRWVHTFTGERNDDNPKATDPPVNDLVAALRKLAFDCKGYRWRKWCECLPYLATKRESRDPELLKILLERSTGTSEELAALKAFNYPKLPEWVNQHLTQAVERAPIRRDDEDPNEPEWMLASDTNALLDQAFSLDEKQATQHLEYFITQARPHLLSAALQNIDHINNPELNRRTILRSLEYANGAKDYDLAMQALEKVDSLEFDTPDLIRKEIEKLPEDKADSEWQKERKEALDHLKEKYSG